MLPAGARVLVCVSGGVDSMCLLDVLMKLRGAMGFELFAAHYNHGLRGAESDGDESFVRSFCEKTGVPLSVGCGDVAGEAKRRGTGIEETARELRYGFFRKTAGALDITRIATAHNADDDLETVLMRLVRGTGLRGLCGIPPVSGRIVRPLLFLPRSEIEGYCRENGIPWREDSTNASDEYTRNRLRHRVVPALRELNPSLSVTEMTRLLRQDEEYLSSLAEEFLREHASGNGVPAEKLAALPFPVASRAVRALFGEKLIEAHVEAVLALAKSADPSGKVSLPGLTVRREYGLLTADKAEAKTFEAVELPLDRAVIIEEIGLKFTCTPYTGGGIYKSLTNFPIKSDTIKAGIFVRPRRTGDELRLPGGRRSVKKLMIDKRIPAHLRESVPVIVSGEGRVLAVLGLGQDVDTLPAKGEPAFLITTEKAEG